MNVMETNSKSDLPQLAKKRRHKLPICKFYINSLSNNFEKFYSESKLDSTFSDNQFFDRIF